MRAWTSRAGGRRRTHRLLLTLLGVGVAWLGCQPKDVRPGLWLRGEPAAAKLAHWPATDDVEEIFIETRTWYGIPHSTTIWCVERAGELYVGSYGDEKKAWERNVERSPEARLSIAGRLYEVTLTPVEDPDLVAALNAAYGRKYDMHEVFGDDVPPWWYYRADRRARP